ncbi:MAG TPA: hypothetical protein VHO03_17120 [Ignavibacteriales bacterium]|nr:hypothetical protein [Ignavibacteriales bacterium]
MSERLHFNITQDQLKDINLNFLIEIHGMLKTVLDSQINLTAAITGESKEAVKDKFMEKLNLYTLESTASVIAGSEG